MIARVFDVRCWQCVRLGLEVLFDRFLRQPCNGAVTIVRGLVLAVPVLLEAWYESIVSQLSPAERVQIGDGLELLWEGWLQVRWFVITTVLVMRLGWLGLLLSVAYLTVTSL